MADLRDITGKNRKFKGTTGITVGDDTATTAQRVDEKGRLRFNDTTDLLEYYTGSEWKSIDAPPTIISFSVDGRTASTSQYIVSGTSGSIDIDINGSLFSDGISVTFLGTGGGNVTPSTTTFNSGSSLTATINDVSVFNASFEPWTVKVENPSGLSAQLDDALVVDAAPVFTNAADTNFDIQQFTRSSVSIPAASLCGATDPDGDALTYTITSGSLPSGLSINSGSGEITGTLSGTVSTDTVSTFTVTASGSLLNSSRQFTVTEKPEAVETFTTSGTFSVPTGLTAVDVLVVAGGGTSGRGIPTNVPGGGGGAGGLIFRPGFTVTPGGTVSVTVGGGGSPAPSDAGTPGQDSVFGTLTAKGGGGGGAWSAQSGQAGGSGGGGGPGNGANAGGGSGTQPGQPGDSGTYGFGNGGGSSSPGWNPTDNGGGGGGGGGGAGAGGGNASGQTGGSGGNGRSYDISGSPTFYAGGGGGGGPGTGPGGQGGGGNGAGPVGPNTCADGQGGANNTGGGGGGPTCRGNGDTPNAASGGPGIVIVTY